MDDPKTYNFSFPELAAKNALHFAFRKHTKIERILKRIDVELQKDGTESGVRQFLFHGIGDGCERCVSCVEVLKSRLASQGKNVFQWNALSNKKTSSTTTENSSKCDEMEALKISENSPNNGGTTKPSKKDENRPQPVLAILISLDPFSTTDSDDSQHSLSQQRSDQQQNLPPFFAAQLDENNDQPKQKRTKKKGVGMAKRTKTGAGNKWKRPGKGATTK